MAIHKPWPFPHSHSVVELTFSPQTAIKTHTEIVLSKLTEHFCILVQILFLLLADFGFDLKRTLALSIFNGFASSIAQHWKAYKLILTKWCKKKNDLHHCCNSRRMDFKGMFTWKASVQDLYLALVVYCCKKCVQFVIKYSAPSLICSDCETLLDTEGKC